MGDSPTNMPTSNPTRNPTASPTSDCQSSFLSYNGKCYGTVDWDLKPEPVRFGTPVSSSADNCDIEEWHEIPDGCNLAPAQGDITQNVVGKYEFGTYLLILANGGAYQNPTYGATAGQRHLSHNFLQMGPTARHYKTKCCGCKLLLQCDIGFGIETNPTANPIVAPDTTCHICPSGTIQYPGTHRCFARKWSGFLCNLDPATDPAKHHANDPKCVCSGPIFDDSSAEGQCMSGNYDVGTVLRQKDNTIHKKLSMPTAFNSQSRQWILNLGQWNTGAHHWIWNSSSQIQFGRWSGEQIQTFDIRVCNSLTMVVEPSTQMKLFCKGQLVGTHQGSVPFDVQNANLAVAFNLQEQQGFTGCVKRVKIWSRALTYSEVQQQVSTDTDTTCGTCPSGTIQYPGTHRCFERKWSGFVCNLDPATDPAKHHANERKCVCSGAGRRSLKGRLMDMNLRVEN